MKNQIKMVFKNILNRRVRSWLTILGIIIGVTALVSLITLAQSLEEGIGSQFDKFGTRRIFIGPKSVGSGIVSGAPQGTSTLTTKDVESVERVPYVEYVTPMRSENMKVEYGREEAYRQVFGIGLDDVEKSFEDLDINIEKGRMLEEGDKYNVVLGYQLAKEYFEKEIHVKNSIKIDGVKFRVIGIFEEQGDQDNDFRIMIPIETIRDMLNEKDTISAITAMIKPGIDVTFAAERIKKRLEKDRDDENFEVTNPKKIQEQSKEVIGVVKWVVGGIAFISLIVGAIGIMNSMYTAVMERTREIGVMKAIGAKNRDILSMYIIESAIMGFAGGIIGIILGLIIAFGLGTVISALGVKIIVRLDFNLIIMGIFFTVILGVASGILPAYRASILKPVDALRYE